MGKLVLITVLGAILMAGILNLSTNRNLNFSLGKSVDYYARTTTRNIANSTIEILKTKLSTDNSYRVESRKTMDLFRGTATYTIRDVIIGSDSLVEISVTANYFGIEKNVTALLKINENSELPPFLGYAIIGQSDVQLNGANLAIKNYNNPNQNTNVHSNQKLITSGPGITVEGFGSAVTQLDIQGTTFSPNNNPKNLPTKFLTSEVEIPVINVSDYSGIADETYNSDKTYSGNITLGTKADPKIIFVKGKLFIKGVISGYGSFIAQDDIEITGDLTIDSPDPNVGNLFLMSNKKVLIKPSGIMVYANIYSPDDVPADGDGAIIYGSIASRMKVIINDDNIKLYYKPLAKEIASDFFPATSNSTGRIKVLHWYE